MKIIGYCLGCRRIKRVNVTAISMKAGILHGTCDECEKRDERNKPEWP